MSDLLTDVTRPGLEQAIRRVLFEILEEVFTGCPGTITSYDPEQRRAQVTAGWPLRYLDPTTGDVIEEEAAQIDNVPVHFPALGGDFECVCDLTPPLQCWLKFSKCSLEDWLSTGQVGKAGQAPPFQISDAVAEVGLNTLAAPGNPVPAKSMRLGAKDGPQVLIDLTAQKLTLSSLNEIDILAGALIRIESASADVMVQRRRVNPVTPEDL